MSNQIKNNAPFFIVGSGRSGSTLLRLILCAHSQVSIPPETYFIAPLIEQLPINQELDKEQISLAIEIMTDHYRWADMMMSKEDLVSNVPKGMPLYISDLLDIVYEYHLDRDDKQIWGDKTPPYIAIVPQLLELYPNAKIIFLVRDGRDVTKSFQATGWYGTWLHENTREWKDAVLRCKQFTDALPNIDIYEVKYENLVLDTEETVRNLCDYLSIEYESEMLDWGAELEGKIPAREAHIHTKVSRKPGKGDVYRWKNEMSKRELLVVESFIFSELKSAGYTLYYSSPLWIIVFFVCRAYYALIFPVYAFVLRVFRYVGRKLEVLN